MSLLKQIIRRVLKSKDCRYYSIAASIPSYTMAEKDIQKIVGALHGQGFKDVSVLPYTLREAKYYQVVAGRHLTRKEAEETKAKLLSLGYRASIMGAPLS